MNDIFFDIICKRVMKCVVYDACNSTCATLLLSMFKHKHMCM